MLGCLSYLSASSHILRFPPTAHPPPLHHDALHGAGHLPPCGGGRRALQRGAHLLPPNCACTAAAPPAAHLRASFYLPMDGPGMPLLLTACSCFPRRRMPRPPAPSGRSHHLLHYGVLGRRPNGTFTALSVECSCVVRTRDISIGNTASSSLRRMVPWLYHDFFDAPTVHGW